MQPPASSATRSKAVRKWHQTFRAVGRDALLDMGKKPCEIRLRDQGGGRERGRGRRDGQAGGDESASESPAYSPLDRHGAGSTGRAAPRPSGPGPRAGRARARARRRPRRRARRSPSASVRKLEAQVAYLKKSIALKVELGLPNRERAAGRSRAFGAGAQTSSDLLECGRPREVDRTTTRSRNPKGPTRPELRGTGSPRSSEGSRTASATGRWRWSCGPWTAPA